MAPQGRPEYLRLTRFFGTLLVINVAVGVVTGLVQEFQFGMNWSAYSRFVGDVFGAPLAMEGLAAFFLESVFLGLWLFGWDRLSTPACTWPRSGRSRSAVRCRRAFIMAANSWMQRPVGYAAQPGDWPGPAHRHLGGAHQHRLPLGVPPCPAGRRWSPAPRSHARRCRPGTCASGTSTEVFQRSARLALIVLIPSIMLRAAGRQPAGRHRDQVPAHEDRRGRGQWNTCQPCSFSLFQIGGGNNDQTPTKIIQVPHLLSLLSTSTWNGQVIGLNELQAQYEQQYGPGNYVPERVHPVLVDAGDGVRRSVLVFLVALVGGVAAVAEAGSATARWFLRRRDLGGDPLPFMHEHRRLAADRERPPAVDRAGPAADHATRVSPSVGTATIVTSIIVFVAALRRAGRGGLRADDPFRPQAAARRPRPGAGRRRAIRLEFTY